MFQNDFSLLEIRGPFGIPVHVGFTTLILALALVHLNSTGGDFLSEAIVFVLLMGSIYLHELGHALGARLQGLRVHRIMLSGGGGRCDHARASDHENELIVAMGPIVNLSIWAVCSLILPLLSEGTMAAWLVHALGFINLFLAILNLMPVKSLDGGKLLRLTLMRVMPEASANRILGVTGLICAAVWIPAMLLSFVLFGLALLVLPSFDEHLQMLRDPEKASA